MTAASPSRALAMRCVSRALRSISIINCLLRRGVPLTPRRILVVKLDAIGDLVLTTPFLRELKRSFPNARITLVVTPATAPLVRLCPYVDKVLEYEPFGSNREERDLNTLRAHLFATRLSFARYDVAVLPRWDFDFSHGYHLLCGSGARHVASFARTFAAVKMTWAARVEQRRATIVRDEEPEHEVRRNLRLIEALGGTVASDKLELWLSTGDRRRAADWLTIQSSTQRGPVVAFGIGASTVPRCWPEERFAELGRYLVEQLHARVILLGRGDADKQRAGAILEATQSPSVFSGVDALSLRETAALLERCPLFIGNDSGPMHLAAAVGTPVVEICGLVEDQDPNHSFSPARFGPWQVPARVVRPARVQIADKQNPSDNLSLKIHEISVAAVVKASLDLLRAQQSHSSRTSGLGFSLRSSTTALRKVTHST